MTSIDRIHQGNLPGDDESVFGRLVTPLEKQSALAQDVLTHLTNRAILFATTAQREELPVERARGEQYEEGDIVTTTYHPVWQVLQHRDLTGRDMSLSLGRERTDKHMTFSGQSIGITPAGKLTLLHNDLIIIKDVPGLTTALSLLNEPVKPDHLFDRTTSESLVALTGKIDKKLAETLRILGARRDNEIRENHGQLGRDAAYYEVATETTHKLPATKDTGSLLGKIGRFFTGYR